MLVAKIFACEGLIHIDEIAKCVASCHRIERAGARIKRVTDDVLRRSTELKNDRAFWRLAISGDLVVRDRSQVTSLSLKSAEFLPPFEIDLALCLIIKGDVRVEEA